MAIYLGDTLRFYDFLKACFRHGMLIDAVNSCVFICNVNSGEIKRNINKIFKKESVSRQVDQELYDKLCHMSYQSDSHQP